MRDLQAGSYINAGTIGAEVHLPFGGTKDRQRPSRSRPGCPRRLHSESISSTTAASCRRRRSTPSLNRKLVVSFRARLSTRCAMPSSRRAPDASASTSTAPGTHREQGPSRRRGTTPAAATGREQRVAELRLETDFPEERQEDVIAALRRAHPYEKLAFDLRIAVKARLFTDGGSRGNPGPAAYGYVLGAEEGHVLAATARRSDARRTTSRSTGLVAGLKKAAELGIRELDVVSDSELLSSRCRASIG